MDSQSECEDGGFWMRLAAAQDSSVHSSDQANPPNLPKGKVMGSGTCEVLFDAAGSAASVRIIKSTGSKILDENTVSYGYQHWTGQPNSRALVPILYTGASPAKHEPFVVRVNGPNPPYPNQARAAHLQGTGSVSVTFDESGKAIRAEMTKSTGQGILDDNTIAYALANWKSSGGKKTTVSVPVAYRIQ